MNRCHYCLRKFEEGDHAYIQEVKSVKVVGTKVRQIVSKVVVCTTCAK